MNVTVFGMGIIGAIWAENLEREGHRVRRWNRSARELPNFVSDAREAAKDAELLIIVVADPAAVQAVLDQILPVLTPSQIVMQSSTVAPGDTKRFAEQVIARGAAYLEAPFTGSKPAAEQRKIVYFIGGGKEVLERARPALQSLSGNIEHIGAIGSASALKLAMNVNVALVTEALCESLAVARAAGIPDERYFSILKLNTSYSRLADIKQPKLQTADYSPQFSIKHMAKDLRIALGENASLRLPQTAALLKMYEEAVRNGWANDDFVALMKLIK